MQGGRERRTGTRRAALALGLFASLCGSALFAASAAGSFHLNMVREVFPGSTANPGQDYVVLQMYASGENFVAGHTLTVYAPNGSVTTTVSPVSDAPNGQNQDTILFGAASTVVGVPADFVAGGLTAINPAGGAVCWAGVDCVSWGSFNNTSGTPLPSPAGSPASSISDNAALFRRIDRACSTLLEASDDTDDGAADFSLGSPAPRNNATTPIEKPCPNTTITKGPSGKTHDRTPTFKFKSSVSGSTFECKLDNAAFASCTSPVTTEKLARGKHKFQVRASRSGAADPTPAKSKFKVVKN